MPVRNLAKRGFAKGLGELLERAHEAKYAQKAVRTERSFDPEEETRLADPRVRPKIVPQFEPRPQLGDPRHK
jgi:hypothetical protein